MTDNSQPLHEAERQITRGMLGLKVYAMLVRATDKWTQERERRLSLIAEHIQYFIDLEKQDKCLLAGPFIDDADRPDGLIILKNFASLDEAKAAMAGDVFIAEGFRTVEANTWLLNEGSLDIRITLSDRGMMLA